MGIEREMREIQLSKQRMRRKLAQLPIAEKLRIVEQLRDDGLPTHGKPGAELHGVLTKNAANHRSSTFDGLPAG
jgi:hypothetical protein